MPCLQNQAEVRDAAAQHVWAQDRIVFSPAAQMCAWLLFFFPSNGVQPLFFILLKQ